MQPHFHGRRLSFPAAGLIPLSEPVPDRTAGPSHRPRSWPALLLGAVLWGIGLSLLPAPVLAQVNLLTNGSFEQPAVTFPHGLAPTPVDSLPGWTEVSHASLAAASSWQPASGQGQQTLLLGDDLAPGTLEQSFPTRPGQSYLVSGWLAHDPRSPASPGGELQLMVEGQLLASFQHQDAAATRQDMRWVMFTQRFSAIGETTHLQVSGRGVVLDGLAVTLSGSLYAPAPFSVIDLSLHLTHRLTDGMLGPGNDLVDLAHTITPETPLPVLLGVPFLLDGTVLVGPTTVNGYKLPKSVEGIPVGRKARHLYFLQANHYSQPLVGTQIGSYVLHYEGGSTVTVPLRYGKELADWWTYPSARAAVPVAWQGRNQAATNWDRETDFTAIVGRPLGIQLFLMTWSNPTPEVAIESLDVVAFHSPGDPIALPFLVAVTGD